MARPILSLGRVAAISLIASGCYSDSAAFISRAAKLSCVNARECENAAYEMAFGSMRECRDAVEEQLHDELDPIEGMGCEYIAEKGRECIHAMFKVRKDCDIEFDSTLSDACDAVFVCPAGAGRVGIFPMGASEVIERAGQPDDE